jgi:hypothetical protein
MCQRIYIWRETSLYCCRCSVLSPHVCHHKQNLVRFVTFMLGFLITFEFNSFLFTHEHGASVCDAGSDSFYDFLSLLGNKKSIFAPLKDLLVS